MPIVLKLNDQQFAEGGYGDGDGYGSGSGDGDGYGNP